MTTQTHGDSMYLLRIPSLTQVQTAGTEGLELLDRVENDSRDALLWTLNDQERRLIAARLRHIRRLRHACTA